MGHATSFLLFVAIVYGLWYGLGKGQNLQLKFDKFETSCNVGLVAGTDYILFKAIVHAKAAVREDYIKVADVIMNSSTPTLICSADVTACAKSNKSECRCVLDTGDAMHLALRVVARSEYSRAKMYLEWASVFRTSPRQLNIPFGVTLPSDLFSPAPGAYQRPRLRPAMAADYKRKPTIATTPTILPTLPSLPSTTKDPSPRRSAPLSLPPISDISKVTSTLKVNGKSCTLGSGKKMCTFNNGHNTMEFCCLSEIQPCKTKIAFRSRVVASGSPCVEYKFQSVDLITMVSVMMSLCNDKKVFRVLGEVRTEMPDNFLLDERNILVIVWGLFVALFCGLGCCFWRRRGAGRCPLVNEPTATQQDASRSDSACALPSGGPQSKLQVSGSLTQQGETAV